MGIGRGKYRRLTDLYTDGQVVPLKGGDVLWMQVLNPLEKDEATHDAQVAQTRLIMALKSGAERDKVEAAFMLDGRDRAIEQLADMNANKALPKAVEALQSDPEWKERVEIMDRTEAIQTAAEESEKELLQQINQEYLDEIFKRQNDERDFWTQKLESYSDEELLEEYIEAYRERRGGERAHEEYQLTEVWFSARVCEAKPDEAEESGWNHDDCEGHRMKAFETKADVASLPEKLQILLYETMQSLNMSVRDARFSDRQGSSSDSSPLPSAPVDSTPSTSEETPSEVPGTSPSLSPTP